MDITLLDLNSSCINKNLMNAYKMVSHSAKYYEGYRDE